MDIDGIGWICMDLDGFGRIWMDLLLWRRRSEPRPKRGPKRSEQAGGMWLAGWEWVSAWLLPTYMHAYIRMHAYTYTCMHTHLGREPHDAVDVWSVAEATDRDEPAPLGGAEGVRDLGTGGSET